MVNIKRSGQCAAPSLQHTQLATQLQPIARTAEGKTVCMYHLDKVTITTKRRRSLTVTLH